MLETKATSEAALEERMFVEQDPFQVNKPNPPTARNETSKVTADGRPSTGNQVNVRVGHRFRVAEEMQNSSRPFVSSSRYMYSTQEWPMMDERYPLLETPSLASCLVVGAGQLAANR